MASPDGKIGEIEEELKALHDTLQRMGKNSKNSADVFGRRFNVPVDAEHKATQDPLCVTLCNLGNPHMRGARAARAPSALRHTPALARRARASRLAHHSLARVRPLLPPLSFFSLGQPSTPRGSASSRPSSRPSRPPLWGRT